MARAPRVWQDIHSLTAEERVSGISVVSAVSAALIDLAIKDLCTPALTTAISACQPSLSRRVRGVGKHPVERCPVVHPTAYEHRDDPMRVLDLSQRIPAEEHEIGALPRFDRT